MSHPYVCNSSNACWNFLRTKIQQIGPYQFLCWVTAEVALEKDELDGTFKCWIQWRKDLSVGECDSSPKLLTVKQTGSVIYRKGGVALQLKYFTSQSHHFSVPPTTPLWKAYHLTAPSRSDAYIIIKKKYSQETRNWVSIRHISQKRQENIKAGKHPRWLL